MGVHSALSVVGVVVDGQAPLAIGEAPRVASQLRDMASSDQVCLAARPTLKVSSV